MSFASVNECNGVTLSIDKIEFQGGVIFVIGRVMVSILRELPARGDPHGEFLAVNTLTHDGCGGAHLIRLLRKFAFNILRDARNSAIDASRMNEVPFLRIRIPGIRY